MSVISKELAKKIATKLTEKSKNHLNSLRTDYTELVTIAYEATVPKNIMDLFIKDKTYFDDTSSISFNGHGFNYEQVTSTRRVPSNYSGYHCNLELTPKVAEKLIKAKQRWEKAAKSYKTLFDETEQALLSLKTYNNIRKELPEAAPYLPPPLSNALVVNFTSLKSRLNKQPEATTVSVE